MFNIFNKTNKHQIESKPPACGSINPNVNDMINDAFARSQKPHGSTASSSASPNIVGRNEKMENDSTPQPRKENDVGRAPPGRQRRMPSASIGQDEAYNQVCNFLKDDKVEMVGIYGMGGVGKTTLMKKLDKEFLKPSNFKVIWVIISRIVDMDMIQEVIMENLNLALNKHDNRYSRADKINNALWRNKVAILFDDIWECLDLEKLGILGQENLDAASFKLIFTTRSKAVCEEMQSAELIKVDPLGWDDSWALFKRSVGSKNDIESCDSSIVEISKDVARECKGLPLALEVIGRAMASRRHLEEWRHALATLRRHPADIPAAEGLFTRLKFSFDSLSNRREKGCFLYTCFYPEDRVIEADMLIECWIGEGILTLKGSYQEALDEGINIFRTLQAACLFETLQDSRLSTRIHDVIRDMGIWIANSHEITDKTESRRYSVWCEKYKGPEEAICSSLTTLIIGSEVGKFNPFTSMSKLRVIKLRGVEFDEIPTSIGELTELRHLELIDTILERLPDEIRNLRKLQVMHVHNRFQDMNIDLPEAIGELTELRRLVCSTRNIPTEIGNLHKLEELVLDKSEIEELPKTVGRLTELRKLDVRGQKCRVGTLPVEVGNLKKLEELRKDSYLVEFPQVICQLVNLKKLFLKIQARVELPIGFGNLNKLEIFKLDERYSSFHCVELIPNDTFRNMHKLRELSLPIRNFKILPPSFFQGLTSLKSLSFRYQGSDSDKDEIVEEADVASFLTQSSSLPLRTLIIERCPIKKFQVPPTSNDLCFPWLEELHICYFDRLEKMQVMSQTALPSVRVLKITRCDSLKHISGLEHLQSLVELEIEECRKLEEVIQVAGDKTLSDHSPGICFPKLEKLGLWYLPQLKSICIDAISFPSLRYFRLVECPEPRVLPRGLVKENKAKLKDGSVVAIKKLTVKMETISKIKHRNLVPLLGYCKVGERLLVYEYMKYGSLEDVLHDRRKAGIRLNWPARRKIAVGAARGLAFLHHNCIPHIIHGDMKPRNVLLDENLEARVSDFGMASLMSDLSVSTLAGTPGYVPPEYYQSFRCSTKGDVYSYGVVLLELLTSRQPTDSSDFGDNNLVGWVKQHAKLKISDVFDPMLMKEDPALEVELLQHLKVAWACLDDRPWRRPTMIQVMAMFKEIQAGNNGDSGDTDEGSNFGVVDISLKEEPELTRIKSENGKK